MATAFFGLRLLRRKRQAQQSKLADIAMEVIERPLNSDGNCRICLKRGEIPIFSHENTIQITESIQVFGDIKLNSDDSFPKHVCKECYSLLQSAILFRKLAKETDSVLHQILKNTVSSIDHSNNEINEELSGNDYCEGVELDKDIKLKYRCNLCKIEFKNSQDYQLHKNSKQHRKICIQCTVCNKILTVNLFKRHLARHNTASHLICEVCGKIFRKDNLLRHVQLHSSTELPFQCSLCPYKGRYSEALKLHMRSHTGYKPHSCDKCHLRFITRSNLNRHLLTHKKEKPFKCNECGRGFYTNKDVESHHKSDHIGIKEFECQMCGNKYGSKKGLSRHERTIHKRKRMPQGGVPLYLRAEYNQT